MAAVLQAVCSTPLIYVPLASAAVIGAGYAAYRASIHVGYCNETEDFTGKVIVITGGSTGIGLETARLLARQGQPTIIITCRDLPKGRKAVDNIKQFSGNSDVTVHRLDLGDRDSIKAFVEALDAQGIKRVDRLILNAGMTIPVRQLLKDGSESTIGSNHFGTMYLTYLMLPKVQKAQDARIVVLSSGTHYGATIDWDNMQFEKGGFDSMAAYPRSKLFNVLFVQELAARLRRAGSNISVFAVCPGLVTTELARDAPLRFQLFLGALRILRGKNVFQGAQTSLYATISKDLRDKTGLYLSECQVKEPNKLCNPTNAARLWSWSCDWLGIPKDWPL